MIFKPLVKGLRLDVWTKIAITIAIFVYLSVIGLSFLFPDFDFRIILLVVGLVYLGMPHGAMDIYLVAKSIRSPKDVFLFVSSYLILALIVLVFWSVAPTLTFLIFITYSMFHFADSDIQKKILDNKLNLLEFFARVPLTFCLPLIFHEQATLKLINFIHNDINFLPYVFYFKFFGYLGLALTLVFTVINTFKLIKDFSNQDLTFLEPLVLCVLFSQISPLYALGIYFCFIHSVKHIINVLKRVNIRSAFSILPYWLLPLTGLPIMFWIYVSSSSYKVELFQSHVFQYILITLSALAFPHALLVRYNKHINVID